MFACPTMESVRRRIYGRSRQLGQTLLAKTVQTRRSMGCQCTFRWQTEQVSVCHRETVETVLLLQQGRALSYILTTDVGIFHKHPPPFFILHFQWKWNPAAPVYLENWKKMSWARIRICILLLHFHPVTGDAADDALLQLLSGKGWVAAECWFDAIWRFALLTKGLELDVDIVGDSWRLQAIEKVTFHSEEEMINLANN